MNFYALMVPFGLVLARMGSFVVACPSFAPEQIMTRVRAALVAVLSVVLTLSLPRTVVPQAWLPAALLEVSVGCLMGIMVRFAMVAVSYAGELFDAHVGFSFSHQVNPLTQEDVGPLAHLSQIVGGLIFFTCGGQHYILRALAESLRRIPPGSGSFAPGWGLLLSEQMSLTFAVGLKIAVPLVAMLMCTQLGLALLARVAPQLNIWGVGFLTTTGIGLMVLWAFTPAWLDEIAELYQNQSNSVALLWRR